MGWGVALLLVVGAEALPLRRVQAYNCPIAILSNKVM